MLTLLRSAIIALALISTAAWAGKPIEITTSRNDIFRIYENDQWNIRIERYIQLQSADIRIDDKLGYPFSLALNFKADTPRQARFNSQKKMAQAVRTSSEKLLPASVEKTINLKKVPVRSTYGFYTVLTNAEVAMKASPGPGEFKYITRGMVRLSRNTALEFSLMTNEVDSFQYKKMLNYVYSFVKPGRK